MDLDLVFILSVVVALAGLIAWMIKSLAAASVTVPDL